MRNRKIARLFAMDSNFQYAEAVKLVVALFSCAGWQRSLATDQDVDRRAARRCALDEHTLGSDRRASLRSTKPVVDTCSA